MQFPYLFEHFLVVHIPPSCILDHLRKQRCNWWKSGHTATQILLLVLAVRSKLVSLYHCLLLICLYSVYSHSHVMTRLQYAIGERSTTCSRFRTAAQWTAWLLVEMLRDVGQTFQGHVHWTHARTWQRKRVQHGFQKANVQIRRSCTPSAAPQNIRRTFEHRETCKCAVVVGFGYFRNKLYVFRKNSFSKKKKC